MGDEMEQLEWVGLRAANRSQAKSSTARLIVPRAPEVAEELGVDLTDAQFLSVEEYLLDHGYVVPANIGLTWGTYTVTPSGLRWLEAGSAERSAANWLRELADKPTEELAFESTIRAELEKEQHRMGGVRAGTRRGAARAKARGCRAPLEYWSRSDKRRESLVAILGIAAPPRGLGTIPPDAVYRENYEG